MPCNNWLMADGLYITEARPISRQSKRSEKDQTEVTCTATGRGRSARPDPWRTVAER
ncbi:hypothetical protein LSH36_18g08033, partial [Paralvinella palmiformis]